METSKAFVFFPAEIKLLTKLLTLDLDAIGLSKRDQVLAASALRTLQGKPPARQKFPIEPSHPREIRASDIEGALLSAMRRR